MTAPPPSLLTREWLEPDGRGGFASGTASGIRSRRYHALLLAATTPPTGRVVLVNGFDAWITIAGRRMALTSQHYAPDATWPDGASRMAQFTHEPWPTTTWRIDDIEVTHDVMVVPGPTPVTLLRWRIGGDREATLEVIPFLSGRDYHATHHENAAARLDAQVDRQRVVFQPYPGVVPVVSESNATYAHRPDWYRQFLYRAEAERGLDAVEDLVAPGVLTFALGPRREAVWMLSAGPARDAAPDAASVSSRARRLIAAERTRRAAYPTPLHRAADAYVVSRGQGKTIVAGYPWFTDWGRDTFIALRGLCLSTTRLDTAEQILVEWAGAVSEGMLPNRFADAGEAPEYNAVDASLWYIVAAGEFLDASARTGRAVDARVTDRLRDAVLQIVEGYARGTRYGIALDADGLVRCGVPGVQLTWMDARVGDWVVTPRVGKPIEVQALWVNALEVARRFTRDWDETRARATASIQARFWNAEARCLFDVVDVDHVPGTRDARIRPNQVFAVGGLPVAVVDGARARDVVRAIEMHLVTPAGLRSLAPLSDGYRPRYDGGPRERDGAYHQGTVWPWLMTSFVDAWLRAEGNTPATRAAARERFLEPLERHLADAGLGHVSEIFDAEAPFTPRGCPFQAWSVGELLRLRQLLHEA